MRRFGTISLLILVITLVFGSAVVAVTGTVNAPSGLVLREEASKTGAPLATVPDKTELEILEECGEWYRVTYNGQTGYIFGEFVNKNEETSVEPEVPAPEIPAPEIPAETDPNAVQAKSKIRVYIIPTVTSTVINEVEPNAQIHIEKQITNWSYIVSGNIQGWVRTYGIQNEIKNQSQQHQRVQNQRNLLHQKLIIQSNQQLKSLKLQLLINQQIIQIVEKQQWKV